MQIIYERWKVKEKGEKDKSQTRYRESANYRKDVPEVVKKLIEICNNDGNFDHISLESIPSHGFNDLNNPPTSNDLFSRMFCPYTTRRGQPAVILGARNRFPFRNAFTLNSPLYKTRLYIRIIFPPSGCDWQKTYK